MRLILNEFNSKFGVFNAAKCRMYDGDIENIIGENRPCRI